METRYIIINKINDDEYNLVKTIRELKDYLTDMYLIYYSHMYYHRRLKDLNRLEMGDILIIKIEL